MAEASILTLEVSKFTNGVTKAKKKKTDFNGNWQFADNLHRSCMTDIEYKDGVLVCNYTTHEWRQNERAVEDVRKLQEHWKILGWDEFAENCLLERLVDELGGAVKIVNEHKIENPTFYYYDENDREPATTLFEMLDGDY